MKYCYMIDNFEYVNYEDFLNDVEEPGWNSTRETAMISVGLFEHINDAFEIAKVLARNEANINIEEDIDRIEESPINGASVIFKDGTVSSYRVIKMRIFSALVNDGNTKEL